MKKHLLIFLSATAIFFSSAITGFACEISEAASQLAKPGFKDIISAFTASPSAITAAVIFVFAMILAAVFGKRISTRLESTTAKSMTSVFIIFFSVFGIAALAMGFATEGETWSNLMNQESSGGFPMSQFEDYILNVKYAGRQHFYLAAEKNSPFSLLMFYLLAQFLPPQYIYSDSFVDSIKILRNQTFMFMYLIMVLCIVFMIYKMARYVLRKNSLNIRDELISFLLVVSYPAIFCIEKGNFSAISLMLSILFILCYKSEKKIARELSLVALAVSAAITPFTIVFAILLLIDTTDRKEALISFAKPVGYFIALFIIPAIFTGFGNAFTFIKAFLNVDADGFITGNMSIVNLLHFFGITNSVIVFAVFILTEAIAILAMFVLPSMWQKIAAATYVMLNIFSVSNTVSAIFIFIPLIFLLAEKKHSAKDWVYMFTFAFIVTPFPEWFRYDAANFNAFLATMNVSVNNANDLIALAALQFLMVVMLSQTISVFKKNKALKTAPAKSEESAA